jgi:hypothetical protein
MKESANNEQQTTNKNIFNNKKKWKTRDDTETFPVFSQI